MSLEQAMKQVIPKHQTPSPRDLLHTLQGNQETDSYNSSALKTTEAEDDLVFSEEEEEKKPHDDHQLVILPTKSWGPSRIIKPKLPEPEVPATQHPEEDPAEEAEEAQETRIFYCPPFYSWQPVFFLEPLGFSTFEVGPKALTGAGLMVHGLHYEASPYPKKTPKDKALKTPKEATKPKGPPPGMSQLLEMFEKNKRR